MGETLLEGWHDLEPDGRQGVSLRSTMERARLRFALPPTARFLAILVSGHASLLGDALRGSIVILRESASGAASARDEPGADFGAASGTASGGRFRGAAGESPR